MILSGLAIRHRHVQDRRGPLTSKVGPDADDRKSVPRKTEISFDTYRSCVGGRLPDTEGSTGRIGLIGLIRFVATAIWPLQRCARTRRRWFVCNIERHHWLLKPVAKRERLSAGMGMIQHYGVPLAQDDSSLLKFQLRLCNLNVVKTSSLISTTNNARRFKSD